MTQGIRNVKKSKLTLKQADLALFARLHEMKDLAALREIVNSEKGDARTAADAILRGLDMRYGIENQFIVTGKTGFKKVVKLDMSGRPCQLKVFDIIRSEWEANRPVRIMIIKARQTGVSTLTEGIFYWIMKHWLYTDGSVYSYQKKNATHLAEMFNIFSQKENNPWIFYIDDSLDGVDHYFHHRTSRFSEAKGKITWDCGGGLDVSTAINKISGKGFSYMICHFSEFAFWPAQEDTLAEAMNTIPTVAGTAAVIETTACGFNYTSDKFKNKEDSWIKIFIPWFDDPTYVREFEDGHRKAEFERSLTDYEKTLMADFPDISLEQVHWRRVKRNDEYKGSDITFGVDFPARVDEAFVGGRQMFFTITADMRALAERYDKCEAMILEYDDETRGVRSAREGSIIIYEKPEVGKEYVIGCDPSEGKDVDPLSRQPESDMTAIVVVERGEYYNTPTPERTVVADYEGRIHPERCPDILEYLCQLFFDAEVMIENNMHGGTVIACGRNRKIKFMPKPKSMHPGLTIHYGYSKPAPVELGFRTTGGVSGTRAKMLDYAHELVDDKLVRIPSKRLIERFETFVKDSKPGSVAKALRGKKDDLVLAFCLALMADKFATTRVKMEMSPEQRWQMYERAKASAKTMAELEAAEQILNPKK